MSYSLTGKREQFCQLVAAGATYTDAYLEAYQKPAGSNRKMAAEEGSRLAHDTDVVLRIQELRRPAIRKFQRIYEYTLNEALEECEIAWNLAHAQSDPRAMLKAIELRGKFVRLLTNQPDVTRRHGLLDDNPIKTRIGNVSRKLLWMAASWTRSLMLPLTFHFFLRGALITFPFNCSINP